MNQRLGVDTGGTFTDFVWLDGNGRWRIHKQLSTPDDPAAAILAGIDQLAIPETAAVVHGSTVATNALLERRGASTALIATEGFTDLLALGRQDRPDLYALVPQKPAPLVPARWRLAVPERVTAQGEVLQPLTAAAVAPVIAQLAAAGIESVAVCLLFSFLHPDHEQLIRREIERAGLAIHVSLSSDILPEYREYERTTTTVINAYVAPLMGRYLTRLAAELGQRPLTVMQSNGGRISAATAGAQAARTVLSGPAGGVVGARFVAEQAGFEQLITFDMGGTSTDVALCPGRLPTTASGEIAGLPLRLPIIDIHTVGAGGGSLAAVDVAGALHVGPQSAGADPGPACYGREIANWRAQQPERPLVTVTDANLVLGRLDAAHFLGGAMGLDVAAARREMAQLAAQMQVDQVETAAAGVLQVANAHMERAIRRISVERGHDPRRFTLVAFGGAGPLHAAALAESLQIPRVLVPPTPGVLSALGMLAAQPTKDYSQTVMAALTAEAGSWQERVETVLAALAAAARRKMAAEGYDPAPLRLDYRLDMRYAGQSHELTIPVTRPLADPRPDFHAAHEQRYGYRQPTAVIEIVTARLTAVVPTAPPVWEEAPLGEADPAAARLGEKVVWFERQAVPTQLYDREKLKPGNQFAGPALIFQYDTTTVVPPGWAAAVAGQRNLLLTQGLPANSN